MHSETEIKALGFLNIHDKILMWNEFGDGLLALSP